MKDLLFKAAVLHKLNEPLNLQTICLPEITQPGSILVKILCTAICGSQVGEMLGVKGPDRYLPHLLGHEALVEVIDSFDSKIVKNGDYAIAHWMKGSGRSGGSLKYKSGNSQINAGEIATFSEFALVSENRLTPMEANLVEEFGPELLCTVGCAYLTAYGVIRNDIGLGNMEQVLLVGGGGVCQAMVILLLSLGVENITVIEQNKNRQGYLARLGVQSVFETFDEVRASKRLYTAIAEFTGRPREIELSYQSLNKDGVLALIGVTPVGQKISLDPMPLHYGQKIVGVYGGGSEPNLDIPKILDLLGKNKMLIKNLNHEILSLSQINQGIEFVKNALVSGRVVIKMHQ